jgi:hypothetical protein
MTPTRKRVNDPEQPRQRVSVSVKPETLTALNQKARQLGYTRSAVAAMAIEQGLPHLTDLP